MGRKIAVSLRAAHRGESVSLSCAAKRSELSEQNWGDIEAINWAPASALGAPGLPSPSLPPISLN